MHDGTQELFRKPYVTYKISEPEKITSGIDFLEVEQIIDNTELPPLHFCIKQKKCEIIHISCIYKEERHQHRFHNGVKYVFKKAVFDRQISLHCCIKLEQKN